MSDCITVKIPGIPTAWAAPFFTGKRGISPKYREKEKSVWEIKKQYGGNPVECPVSVIFTFYMPIPASESKKKKEKMRLFQIYHCKKPDTSNLVKFAEDCLKGIVIKDDNQVVRILAAKEYSENPETLITVLLLKDDHAS